jgi:serine/threonine protein kinase
MSYNIQSLHIRAPEVFYDQQHLQSRKTAVNPSAIDMWSIGIIWLCLELGWIPFDKISDTREMCVWIQYIPSQLRAISYSPHRDIIANLLSHDPAQRFSAEQCLTLLGAEPPHVDLKQFDTMDWSITTKRLEHRSELYQKFANICERFGATVDIFGTCMLIIEHIMKKYITFNPDTHGVAICVIVTHLLGEEGKFLHKMTSPDNIQLVNDLDPDTIVELIPGISHGLPFNRYIYTDIFSDEFKKNLILNCPIWHASDTHLALAIDTKLANKITEQVEQLRAGIHSPSVMTENIESMVYSTNRLCDESVYIEA